MVEALRICKLCKVEKPLNEFYTTQYHNLWCVQCTRAYQREQYKKNKLFKQNRKQPPVQNHYLKLIQEAENKAVELAMASRGLIGKISIVSMIATTDDFFYTDKK